jgi:putative hydrolase of the HAD superfamily
MKLLLWDFDGTLAFREGGMFGAALLEVVGREHPHRLFKREDLGDTLASGFPWHTPDQAHTQIRNPDEWWEQLLFPVLERAMVRLGLDAARAHELVPQVRQTYTETKRWRLYDDSISCLRRLQEKHWTHHILSNHVPELGHIVRALGLNDFIARVHNSAETGYEKPNPIAFNLALRSVPDHTAVWVVGDSIQADVLGAENCGMSAILVRKTNPAAKYYCEHLEDVVNLIESTQQGH